MPISDLACCRECGGHHVYLWPDAETDSDANIVITFSYHCTTCGHRTPDRPTAKDAAEDVDWVPSHQVRFR